MQDWLDSIDEVEYEDEETGETKRKILEDKEYATAQICEIEDIARKVGGKDHHFRFVQAPFSLSEPHLLVEDRA